MAKNLEFVLLLDCYGELLTERQREIAELYYNEDFSLSEIAQMQDITRQAVKDSLRHSEQMRPADLFFPSRNWVWQNASGA